MNKCNIKKQQENLNIIYTYKDFFKKSWTYERMTKEEQDTFNHIFSLSNQELLESLSGTETQKKKTLTLIYSAFLAGLGYNGYSWREKEKGGF